MFFSALLLFWGWSFHLLSAFCFALAEAYISFLQKLVLRPLGYRPVLVPKKVFKSESQQETKASSQATQPARVSDIQQLHSSLAGLQHQVQKLQASSCPSTHQQDNIQRWFHAATFDTQSGASTLTALTAARHRRTSTQPAACAAAAAAMALYSQAGMPADAAAAAVGAAVVFAEQLSSSDPDSTCQSRRESSCCTVPPLEYDVSAEEQRELDDCAPAEFLCPLGRVLMTDPVCTPSGFTYQRSFIEDFLSKTGHDPARDTPLAVQQLYPNISIRDQIATWLQKQGVAT